MLYRCLAGVDIRKITIFCLAFLFAIGTGYWAMMKWSNQDRADIAPTYVRDKAIKMHPTTSLHGLEIFDGGNVSDQVQAAALGFNLLGVHDIEQLNRMPEGVRGVVWVPMCQGVTEEFVNNVMQYRNNPKLWGFYVWDEPQPEQPTCFGSCACPLENLKLELDWIRANIPNAKTVTTLNEGARSDYAGYAAAYDYVALSAFPCMRDKCNFSYIAILVETVVAAGVPREKIVPMYQTFGGGGYLMPSAENLQELIAAWSKVTPSPPLDYVYAWTWGKGTGLRESAELHEVFREYWLGASDP